MYLCIFIFYFIVRLFLATLFGQEMEAMMMMIHLTHWASRSELLDSSGPTLKQASVIVLEVKLDSKFQYVHFSLFLQPLHSSSVSWWGFGLGGKIQLVTWRLKLWKLTTWNPPLVLEPCVCLATSTITMPSQSMLMIALQHVPQVLALFKSNF